MSSSPLPECDLVEKHSLSCKVTKGKNQLINVKHLTHKKPKRMLIKKKKKNQWWHVPIILAPGKQRQEFQELKVITNYIVNLRLVWSIWDPVSKNNINKTRNKPKRYTPAQLQIYEKSSQNPANQNSEYNFNAKSQAHQYNFLINSLFKLTE